MDKAVSFIIWHSLKNMEVEEKWSQIIWGFYVDFYYESLSNFHLYELLNQLYFNHTDEYTS